MKRIGIAPIASLVTASLPMSGALAEVTRIELRSSEPFGNEEDLRG